MGIKANKKKQDPVGRNIQSFISFIQWNMFASNYTVWPSLIIDKNAVVFLGKTSKVQVIMFLF